MIQVGAGADYPDVRLENTADDRPADLIEDGFDIAICVNPPADEALVGRCFMRDEIVVVAAPSMPQPDHRACGRAVGLFKAADDETWRIVEGVRIRKLKLDIVVRLSSLIMVRDATLAGGGAAALPLSLVARDLESGRLARWGRPQWRPFFRLGLHASRRHVGRRVSAFVDDPDRCVSGSGSARLSGRRADERGRPDRSGRPVG